MPEKIVPTPQKSSVAIYNLQYLKFFFISELSSCLSAFPDTNLEHSFYILWYKKKSGNVFLLYICCVLCFITVSSDLYKIFWYPEHWNLQILYGLNVRKVWTNIIWLSRLLDFFSTGKSIWKRKITETINTIQECLLYVSFYIYFYSLKFYSFYVTSRFLYRAFFQLEDRNF